jgi:hypothetical protein
MNNALKQALIVLLGLAMLGSAGCTTTQTIHASQEAITEMKIRPGDKLTLNYATGRAETIELLGLDQEQITGRAKNDEVLVAEYTELVSLQHKRISAGKTAGVILLVPVFAIAAAAGAAEVMGGVATLGGAH